MDQVVTDIKVDHPIAQSDAIPEQQPYFFAPSTLKFFLMSACTIGIYELYWFYKNWVLIKARANKGIMPFWRAFFAPLWAYSCFKYVKLAANEKGVPAPSLIGLLALFYFILQSLWRLPNPYWLASILSFVPLLPMNAAALEINKKIGAIGSENSKFTPWNWVALVGGGLLLAFAIIGSFIPEA